MRTSAAHARAALAIALGALVLCLPHDAVAAPPNDDLADAQVLTGDTPAAWVDLEGAGTEPEEARGSYTRSAWYQWTPSYTGLARLTVGPGQGNGVAWYTGSGASHQSLVEVSGSTSSYFLGQYRWVTAGTPYWVVVRDGGSTYRDRTRLIGNPMAAADHFDDAAYVTPYSVGTWDYNGAASWTRSATRESGEPDHAGFAGSATVWMRVYANGTDLFTVDTQGSDFDTVLGVYTGTSVSTLTQVAANDDAAVGTGFSRVRFLATAGRTYHIAVSGKGTGSGTANIRVFGRSSTDNFADAAELTWKATPGYLGGRSMMPGGASSEPGEPDHGAGRTQSDWFRITPDRTTRIGLRITNSRAPRAVQVYAGSSLGTLTKVHSSGELAPQSVAYEEFDVTAGTTYYIAFTGSDHRSDEYLYFQYYHRQAGDDFADATVITPSEEATTSYVSYTVAATREADEPVHAAAGSHSVWYSWTPTTSTNVRMKVSTTSLDAMLAVYTGTSLGTLVPVASNDDTTGTDPVVEFAAVAGTTYKIAVDTKGPMGGYAYLSMDPVRPANDMFADAEQVPAAGGSFRRGNWGGSLEPGEPQHGTTSGGRSIWWHWTAPSTRRIAIGTLDSPSLAQLAVYTGSTVGGLTLVGRSEDWLGTGRGRLEFVATAGTTYRIAVDVPGGGGGEIDLNVEPPPANDKFGGAIQLGAAGRVIGTTLGGSTQAGEPAHAGNAGGASAWYSWTAGATGAVSFSTAGSSIDTLMGVYTGNAVDTLVGVAANDDTDGTDSRVTFSAVAGATYRIAVDGKDDQRGGFVLRWNAAPHDQFDAAQALSGTSVSASAGFAGASLQAGEPAHGPGVDGTLWYSWTAPVSGIVGVNTSGSTADTVLAAYTGTSLSSLALVQVNDDHGAATTSRLRFSATAGVTYRIALATKSATGGTGWIRLNEVPVNDAFAAATALSGTQPRAGGHLFGATVESGEPIHGGVSSTRSAWWTWTAPSSGAVTIDTRGSDFDTVLAVYTGTSVGALTAVASNDDGAGIAPASRISFSATAGVAYQIAVAGKGSDAGDVVVSVNAPANDDFAAATSISVGSSASSTTRGTTLELFEPGVRSGSFSGWYSWTPAVGQVVEVALTSSGSEAAVNVYTGLSVSSLVPADVVHVPDNSKRKQIVGVAGTTYWIQVVDRTGTDYTIGIPTPPPNDHLATPTAMTGYPVTASGTTVGATFDPIVSSRFMRYDSGNAISPRDIAGDVSGTWYTWTAPSTTTAQFSTGSSARYQIFTGSDPDDLQLLEEDESPYGRYSIGSGVRRVPVVAGTAYTIYVGSDWYRNTSTTSLTIQPPPSIAYDSFASPRTLANPSDYDSEINFNLATCEAGEPSHGGQPCEGTIWYKWTPTSSGTGTVTTEVSYSTLDTMLAVYTGTTLDTLVPVASNDDYGGTTRSRVTWTVTASTTYMVAVGRRNGTSGTLRATTGIMVPNDDWANRATITGDDALVATRTRSSSNDLGELWTSSAHSSWFGWTPSYTGLASFELRNAARYNYVRPTSGAYEPNMPAMRSTTAPAVPSNTSTYGTGETAYQVSAGSEVNVKLHASAGWWDSALDLAVNQSSPNEAFAAAWTMDAASTRTVSDFIGAGSIESGEPAHAGAVTSASLWYAFTPSETRSYRLDTHLSSYNLDTVLGVYTGTTVGGLTTVASANVNSLGTLGEHLTFTGVAGTTYRIAVARVGAGYGFTTLRLDAPANDLAAGATPITGGWATIDSTLANGWHEATEPAFRYASVSTVWHQWTAPGTGPAMVDTLTGTAFDSQVAIYTGDPASPTLVAQNDDYGGTLQSRVDWNATAGTSYWIVLGAWNSSPSYYVYDGLQSGEGDYRLRLTQAPANDDFVDATTVSGWTGTTTADTTLATLEDGEPVHAGTPGGRSIWFSWTAPANGPAVIDTFGSTADTILAVYTGSSVSTLTPIAGNDDWSDGQPSRVSFQAVSGTTYRIAVDSFRAAGGLVTLTVNARPPNDDFANAISVSGTAAEAAGYNTNGSAEASEPAHAGAAAASSIWYTWVAPASGATTIDTFGTQIDTRLAVYTGTSVDALALVAQNDDSPSSLQSRVSFTATAGVSYRIAIDGKLGATGDVLLRINATPPSTPLLVAPSDGGSSSSLTPGLQARFQHDDVAALGKIEFELCQGSAAPAEPWSSNCAAGYQAFSTGTSLSHGSLGIGYPVAPLAQGQQHVWRAREYDGSAWSGWTTSWSFTAQASVSVSATTLGRYDSARSTGAWSIGFGTAPSGTGVEIGPTGSGQTTAGSAIDYVVTSDGSTTTSAQAADFADGTSTMAASNLFRRDRAAGEAVEDLGWTAFSTASQVVERDTAGTATHSWDLRLSVPAGQAPGSYAASVTLTTVSSP